MKTSIDELTEQEILSINSQFARQVFENAPAFFEWLRKRYNLEEDEVISKSKQLWTPHLDYTQVFLIFDRIKQLTQFKSIEITNYQIKVGFDEPLITLTVPISHDDGYGVTKALWSVCIICWRDLIED